MLREIDLPARHLEKVRALLAEHVPEAEVWAFGSRVRGGCHETSDLDLVLRNPASLDTPVPGRGRLLTALQESTIPIFVEVHDWAFLPPAYREEIEKDYAPFPIEAGSS